uniref:Uncharacterized LOC100182958 n=1 Tax=Ciona intestinalis TaxID=7719 RepID=F6S8A1_CIOIN|nr:uncharacterized protein LOC100182958 [Ciona intestinalis]|eukprot:XP_002129872.1 uncharacterized protein LOC100182958 [Ciona intestinalis]
MMTKKSLSFAAVMVAIGTSMIIAGVTSPCIVKVCKIPGSSPNGELPIGGFLPIPPHMRRGPGRIPPHLRKSSEDGGADEGCVEQGLFFVGFAMVKDYVYIATPLEEQEQKLRVVAGLILIGGIGSMLALLFYIVAACNAENGHSDVMFVTSKRNMIATVLLGGSVCLFISGFSLYTQHNLSSIGNSTMFVGKVFSAISGIDSDVTTNLIVEEGLVMSQPVTDVIIVNQTSDWTDSNNVTIPTAESNIEGSSANINFFENMGAIDNWFPYPSDEVLAVLPNPFEVYHPSGSRRKRGIRGSRRNLGMLAMPLLYRIGNADPYFGYSFFLCWFGCFSHVVALVCGVVTWITRARACKLKRAVV